MGIKNYLKNKNLDGIEGSIDSIFELFEKIEPNISTPYNSDEHTPLEPMSGDSVNLFIDKVIKPGYKLDEIIIEKAIVSVYKNDKGRRR